MNQKKNRKNVIPLVPTAYPPRLSLCLSNTGPVFAHPMWSERVRNRGARGVMSEEGGPKPDPLDPPPHVFNSASAAALSRVRSKGNRIFFRQKNGKSFKERIANSPKICHPGAGRGPCKIHASPPRRSRLLS